jgi:LDH2 family malate/lactate/ureidoglycolate dehydrogenase
MIDQIKSCRKRPGVEEILVPGERTHRTVEENLRRGVKVDAGTHRELEEMCREFGLKFELPAKSAA